MVHSESLFSWEAGISWGLLGAELCSLPYNSHESKSKPLVPETVTVFGDRAFKEGVKVKQGHMGGP